MKRFIALGVIMAVCAGSVVAGVREIRTALAEVDAAGTRAAEVDSLARLRESQRSAIDYLAARLADGSMSLAEVVDALEDATLGQPVLLGQLAQYRDEPTDRERLAGYSQDRAKELRGGNGDWGTQETIQGIRR